MSDDRFNRTPRKAGFVNEKRLPRGPLGHALCRQCSTEVAPPRRTFCSDSCIHEWKIRTQPVYARKQVFKRDRGVCALCRYDSAASSFVWEMDHIVPVVEGGGSCGLENLRTLCVPCHRAVTAELKRRLAESRRVKSGAGVVK